MGFWQNQIYPVLPVVAQNWAISAFGYAWQRRRFGEVFVKELRRFKEREAFSKQQWLDYQTIQLRKLLVHAFDTVPLYRARYSQAGFTRLQLERFELQDIRRLPFLTKEDLRHFGTSTLLSSKREKGGQFFSSSGSTGTPTKILYSLAFHQRVNAAMEARVRHWAGVKGSDPRGMIGGRRILPDASTRPPFYRYNWFERQTYFSAYHISLKNARDYLEGMYRHSVRYMTGYAMSNYFLASFLDELGLEVPPLKAVVTSSEKLTPRMREMFQKVYACRAFDSYSGVENCGLISETPEGELLIHPDVGIMEVLNEADNPVSSGEEGKVVSTGLLNFDQPLIRYKIGDRVKLGTNQIPSCGRNMPVVEEIAGREEDAVITPDGRRMVRFHGIFVNLPHVLEGQVVQHDFDHFSVRVVTTHGFGGKEERLIVQRMKSQVGEEAVIEVQPVNEIPRTANGKFRAVISELQH